MQLGVNVDHVATLRNLRDTAYPSVVEVARMAVEHGADFITVHIREDRRHIRDRDLIDLKESISAPINMEMAATEEMVKLAKMIGPKSVCIVPEKREERTTEAGIDAAGMYATLQPIISELKSHGIKTTLFIEPNVKQIDYAKKLIIDTVELHVGEYCTNRDYSTLQHIRDAASYCESLGLECHAGHGVDFNTAATLCKIQGISALNIGHFIICEAVSHGIGHVVQKMKKIITANTHHTGTN